jgi:hypothetical protein
MSPNQPDAYGLIRAQRPGSNAPDLGPVKRLDVESLQDQ